MYLNLFKIVSDTDQFFSDSKKMWVSWFNNLVLHTFRFSFNQLLSYPHFPIKGARCAGSIPNMHWAEARETPWTGKPSITAVQILFTASNLRRNPSCNSLRFRDCMLLYSPVKMTLCKQLMPLFLLCQDTQHSVVHLVALHGQRHCHGTNWPHWSDTECFVSFVSQVPTCASQNKLSCNVAGQKNVGACWGPALPLKGNKCSIAEIYCGFGRLPSTDTSDMVGNLKRGVWSSAASAGVAAGGITDTKLGVSLHCCSLLFIF